jgi:hypothetical protein
MRILNVAPRDISVTLEFTLTEINQLLDFLSVCEFDPSKLDGEKLAKEKIEAFVKQDLFKMLDELTEEYNNVVTRDSERS